MTVPEPHLAVSGGGGVEAPVLAEKSLFPAIGSTISTRPCTYEKSGERVQVWSITIQLWAKGHVRIGQESQKTRKKVKLVIDVERECDGMNSA